MTDHPTASDPPQSIRDTLFGDMPLDMWAAVAAEGEPWISFRAAREALDHGDASGSIDILRGIAGRNGLDSRQYVQAWHFLRQLGVQPSQKDAKTVYGVVVEVGMENGLDLLAAYADLSARYYNFSGAGVVWERPDGRLDAAVQRLLDTGAAIAHAIGPWEGDRPPAPPDGQIRLNLLTPSGLHFGQAPFSTMASDSLGGPAVAAATALMQALIEISDQGRPGS